MRQGYSLLFGQCTSVFLVLFGSVFCLLFEDSGVSVAAANDCTPRRIIILDSVEAPGVDHLENSQVEVPVQQIVRFFFCTRTWYSKSLFVFSRSASGFRTISRSLSMSDVSAT